MSTGSNLCRPVRQLCAPGAARLVASALAIVAMAGLSACASRSADDTGSAMAETALAAWRLRHASPPSSTINTGPGTVYSLPPIQLTRPLAPETLTRLRAEAETWYRSRNAAQAREAYTMLVELDPADGTSWFRLGNLHQQNNEIAAAARAYRKAADVRGGQPEQVLVRRKALVNLALLGLARARQALIELEAEPVDSDTAAARQQVTTQFRQLQGQVNALSLPGQADAVEPVSQGAIHARDRRARMPGTDDATVDPGADAGASDATRAPARKPSRRAGTAPTGAVGVDEAALANGPVRIEYLTGGPKK